MLCLEAKSQGPVLGGLVETHPTLASLEIMIMVLWQCFPHLLTQPLQPSPISQNHNNSSQHLPTANYMPGTWLSPFYVCI